MKKIILTSIICVIALVHMTAQLSSQNNDAFRKHIKALHNDNVVVSIDASNPVNAAHPHMEFFEKQDASYLAWLHTTNTINMKLNNTEDYYGPRKILRNSKGNNTIIFQLTENGVITYDTLRNSVHPNYGNKTEDNDGWDIFGIRKSIAKWRAKDAIKDRNITGKLPEGSMMYISMNGRKDIEVGVLVAAPMSDVTIEIIDSQDQLIQTLVSTDLQKGWTGYKWDKDGAPKGIYQVKVTVDGQSLTQDIKI